MPIHKSKIQHPSKIIFVTLVLILSLISESCLSTKETSSNDLNTLEVQLENILNNVEQIRGLKRTEDIKVNFLDKQGLKQKLTAELLTVDNKESTYKLEILLKTLKLIGSDVNLSELLNSMYLQNILGYYDIETREIYLISESNTITPSIELTLAHEYVHALQQQHFDILTLTKNAEGITENESSLLALIEGDATYVELKYLDKYLEKEERQKLLQHTYTESAGYDTPEILEKIMLFPYGEGFSLVTNILSEGSLSGLNESYNQPPITTEQVIHPRKYFAQETAPEIAFPNVEIVLGQEWNIIHQEVLGEFFLKAYLEIVTNKSIAATSSSGWEGDKYQLLSGPNGNILLLSLLRWESAKDTHEFHNALKKIRLSSDVNMRFEILGSTNQVLVVVGSNEETYKMIVQAFQTF
ncbi:MAG: hypothetical protein FI729_06060 [SAR202 cluster bacterium]|nr:hypothetical protein [SAR202 cluster bacterium]